MQQSVVGLIGCGNISAAYLRAAPMFPQLRVKLVADADLSRAEARAAEFGTKAASVDALLADPEIELVLNLTPPQAHIPVGLAAIAAGKHVHIEKPLGISTAEARKLLDAAAKANLRVGCAPDTFLGGAHQTARKLLDDGAIGRVLSGTAFMMNHGHEHWHPDPQFYYQPGGGPLFDMGPYYLTNLINLLGPVASVMASASLGFTERTISSKPREGELMRINTPTHLTGILTFANGAVITLSTSFDVWKHRHGNMELYGETGSLVVPDPNRFGGTVSLASGRGDWADVPLDHGFAHGNYRIIGLADMASAIHANRAHRCNGELAFHVLEIMEAFLRSSDERRSVDIVSRCDRPAPLPARAELGELA
jgi:predicted dehydrogenase